MYYWSITLWKNFFQTCLNPWIYPCCEHFVCCIFVIEIFACIWNILSEFQSHRAIIFVAKQQPDMISRYHNLIFSNLVSPTIKNFEFLQDLVFRLVQFWMYFHKFYPNPFIWFYFHYDHLHFILSLIAISWNLRFICADYSHFGKIIINPEVSDHFRQEYIARNLVLEYFSCCYYKLVISYSVRFHK